MQFRRLSLLLVSLAVAATVHGSCRPSPVTLATFNIELFPHRDTDTDRVAERLREMDADIIAVQEIRDHAAFQRVVDRVAQTSGRDYRLVLSDCGGDGDAITTGILFDNSRWSLVAAREFPGLQPDGRGSCWGGAQAATVAIVERGDGLRVAAFSVHFVPYAGRFPERKVQWHRLVALMGAMEREFEAHAVALGDFNSTGFSAKPPEEREFVETVVERAGFQLLTRDVACTEYWQPDSARFQPSVLDHIVASDGRWERPQPLGMCQDLRCRSVAADDMHDDFRRVSDHCPVRVEGRW